ncbi:MAG: RagB/SusD family nutrient uptake outer membrane protein, partial [Ruminococcus sp.]|nr:RagB/SusD family nutrient uptake outer membrane protein [Ruminococcus sp.]
HSFNMSEAAGDDRALFDGVGRESIYNQLGYSGDFKDGYAVAKFTNFKTNGAAGNDATFPDMDFFFFRTAEAYLTYAEATARLNGGATTGEGTQAINDLRKRANASEKAAYTLNEILDEWSREFYFEGRRRVDLVRFGKFGGNSDYVWSWKGGTKNGRNFSADRNIFAIPAAQVKGAITQNPGY